MRADQVTDPIAYDAAGRLTPMPTVRKLAVTPVKGLALLHPAAIELEPGGAVGNRRFYLVGPDGRNRSGLAFGPLAAIVAEYDPAAERLTLRFPDGTAVSGDAAATGEHLDVRWSRTRRLQGHVVDGPFAAALSRYVGLDVRLVRAESGEAPQSAPVSIVSEASLEALERFADLPERLDDRRFRMLVTIDGIEAFGEDGWIGREVRLGEAVVRVEIEAARCATTTRDPSTGQRDWDALAALRGLRGVSDRQTIDFGVFGSVVRAGRVAVGDEVTVMPAEVEVGRPAI